MNQTNPASTPPAGSMPEAHHEPPPNPARLCIWQQNLNVSLSAQGSLLNSPVANHWDIIVIQEPHINFLCNTRANHRWHVLYPTHHYTHPQKCTRTITLINAKLNTNSWTQIAFPSSSYRYQVTRVKSPSSTSTTLARIRTCSPPSATFSNEI